MAELTLGPILPLSPVAQPSLTAAPGKVHEAAQQFEALLLGQILKSVRESGGWLGANDPTSDCAMEFAEQQLAALMAQQGGLGLAGLIAQGLDREQQSPPDAPQSATDYKLQP